MFSKFFKLMLLSATVMGSLSANCTLGETIYLEKEPTKQCSECVRRVVFDISGSAIRVLVADVDLKTKKIEKLYNAKIDVDFRKDLAKNPDKKEFSPEIQEYALVSLNHLQNAAAKYFPNQSAAVAAEAFRFVSNGEQLINQLSMSCQLPIHITSSQEKGQLEFLSGVANSDVNPENIVVIDMCSMNAHITGLNAEGSFVAFGQKLGYGMIDELIAKKIRKLSKTPQDINPVSAEEALQVIDILGDKLNDMPEALKTKLMSQETNVVATFTPVVGEESWKKANGWQFLQDKILNHLTEESCSPLLTSKALFIYTLLDKFNVEECKLIGTDAREGSASGVLISDPYWTIYTISKK